MIIPTTKRFTISVYVNTNVNSERKHERKGAFDRVILTIVHY